VHHTYYDGWKDPWDYDDESLRTLCENCHNNRAHAEITKDDVDIFYDFKRLFFTSDPPEILNLLKHLSADLGRMAVEAGWPGNPMENAFRTWLAYESLIVAWENQNKSVTSEKSKKKK
jgi:hypothetical protein